MYVKDDIDLYPYLNQADGIDLATCIHTPWCTAVVLVGHLGPLVGDSLSQLPYLMDEI